MRGGDNLFARRKNNKKPEKRDRACEVQPTGGNPGFFWVGRGRGVFLKGGAENLWGMEREKDVCG